MTHQNHQTNGASLEDCHTNFFALVSHFYIDERTRMYFSFEISTICVISVLCVVILWGHIMSSGIPKYLVHDAQVDVLILVIGR